MNHIYPYRAALGGAILLLLHCFVLPAAMYAGEPHEPVKGIVLDLEDKTPVHNAVVHLEELDRYTTTNAKGVFEFKNIKPGKYTFVVSHLAYKSKSVAFICKGTETEHDFVVYLSPKSFEFSPWWLQEPIRIPSWTTCIRPPAN